MSSGFQLPGFQQSGFQTQQDDGSIVQTLPSLTQAAVGDVASAQPDLPSEVLGRMFRFRPPDVRLGVHGAIAQTLPSLTQSATGLVTDDELVLMLL